MWQRLVPLLRCPLCHEPVELSAFDARRQVLDEEHLARARAMDLPGADFDVWVETGVLLCHKCGTWFPVSHGVPVLLPYATPAHAAFARTHAAKLAGLPSRYALPGAEPVQGERLVMTSFSTEWLAYDFDGVIWEMDYRDHETRFLTELGPYAPTGGAPGRFLELGCGIGITTYLAWKNFGVDAVGVDLSLAAWRATARYRTNPWLHFVQASVFSLPFEPGTFDTVYSRGVLHHTFSTREAFRSLAAFCRPGGTLYLWVYGPKSINDNAFRRSVYLTELAMRWILNRAPAGASTVALAPFALGYVAFNRVRHWRNPRIQPYNYRRALHAARDRFTPEFAHRHDADAVSAWFRDAGYDDLQVVDWTTMPSADHDDYRRNTGVRARRRLPSTPR